MAVFVLIHSPSVGPATWSAVADRLESRGHEVIVPSLLAVGDGGPPFWPRVVESVHAALAGTDPGQPLVLVAHSNAGVFIPVIADGTEREVTCSVFADATVPAASGRTPMAPPEFLLFLRGLAGPDGRLPRWTDWWPEQDVAPMFPDRRVRQVICDEQPRLPLAYYLEQVPAPAGWQQHKCGYLIFSEAYRDQAAEARRRGWPVRSVPGDHLHQIVAPDDVAAALLSLTGGGPGS
jgi:hypothetical protein